MRLVKMSPAMKAAETRRARTRFNLKYREEAVNVARLALTGKTSKARIKYGRRTTAAYLALLSRPGNYRDMALACNWK